MNEDLISNDPSFKKGDKVYIRGNPNAVGEIVIVPKLKKFFYHIKFEDESVIKAKEYLLRIPPPNSVKYILGNPHECSS